MNRKMKKSFGFFGLALTSLFFTPAAQSQTLTPPPQAAGYTLTFDDEFNFADVSPNGFGVYNWYPGVWFIHTQAPQSNIVSDGSGQMQLIWDATQAAPETSVEMLSANRQQYTTFRYGYFEARMKWDPTTGAWPAFWMIPVQDANGSDIYNGVKESGELDVFEGQGNQPNKFTGTIHDWVNNVQVSSNKYNTFKLPDGNDFSQYHTYGVLWQPGQVTWYYDNRALASAPTPAIFDKQDYFLVLGMQEGANWQYGNRTGVTASKMTLTVNWLRVWQNK